MVPAPGSAPTDWIWWFTNNATNEKTSARPASRKPIWRTINGDSVRQTEADLVALGPNMVSGCAESESDREDDPSNIWEQQPSDDEQSPPGADGFD